MKLHLLFKGLIYLTFFVAGPGVLLSGCAFHSYKTVEATALSSPDHDVYVSFNHDLLGISLHNKNPDSGDLKSLRLVDTVIIGNSGKELHLGPPKGGGKTDGSTNIYNLKKSGFNPDSFGLRLVLEGGGRKLIITGKYSIHNHTQFITIFDVMDNLNG